MTFIPERLETAGGGGLDVMLNSTQLKERVREMREGSILPAIYVDPSIDQVKAAHQVGAMAVELSGARTAVETGVKLPRIGGRYVLIGSTFPTPPIALDPESVVRRCLTIVGNHNYRPEDLGTAVAFLDAHGGQFPFADLVHDEYSLPDAEAAFARAIEGKDLRVAVRPEWSP